MNGVFMLSEGKALASLGLKPGEVVGKSAFEIYADHPEIMDTVKQVLSGKHLTKEVNVNGCFFEVEHIPMYDSSQNLVGAVGVALEVTRRRYAEQSLKSKENLFQEIFDALPIAVVTATPDRKIERLNPAAEQLFGYTNSNDKRVTIFMHDITDRIQQEELEREKIAAELHEVVSEMLESHENNRAGFQDKLKGKSLTPREMEVLREVASGLSTKQISIKHKVSTKTIESQRLSIMRKLSIFNVADLTKHAIKQGIISLNE